MNIYFKKLYSNEEFENNVLHLRKILLSIKKYEETPIIALELEGFDFVCSVYACYLENCIFIPININTPIYRKELIYLETNPYILNFESLKYNKILKFNRFKQLDLKLNTAGYIIYTSGSTGKPKGIFISKEALKEVINEQIKILNLNSYDRIAWILNPAFDASLSDIFISIFLNLDLYIPDFKITNIKKLSAFYKTNNITVSDIPPSILNLLKFTPQKIIVGGEIIKEQIIKKFYDKEIFISYGPTETTISSSMLKISNTIKNNTYNIDINDYIVGDIGVPLNNNIYKIIDEELYIGNNIRTGIYLDNDLNINKFIILDGIRFFKSGDIVEFKNNQYIYKGRKDRQLKLNGQLICPEEIENVINSHKNVIENRVFYDNKLICEYNGNIKKEVLIEYLKNRLPSYMIPYMIKIEKLDVNDNFKIKQNIKKNNHV
jgi:non-ribosomal peptide synthetase component F